MVQSRTQFAVCVWVSMAAACVSDSSNLCGENMHYARELGVCVCDEHAVASGGACVACAPDEIVVGAACGCPAGEVKDPSNTCAPAAGLGDACDVQVPCREGTYDFCAMRDGAGSCTQKCATDTDCPDTYVCADWEAIPSCRAYTGYGTTCTGAAGCAGYDAHSCLQGYCVVEGCTVGVDDCPRETKCCDFSNYGIGTVCAPAAKCP